MSVLMESNSSEYSGCRHFIARLQIQRLSGGTKSTCLDHLLKVLAVGKQHSRSHMNSGHLAADLRAQGWEELARLSCLGQSPATRSDEGGGRCQDMEDGLWAGGGGSLVRGGHL